MRSAVDQRLLLELTTNIVSKCIESNILKPDEIPGFIAKTYGAFAAVTAGTAEIQKPEPEARSPQVAAVAIEQSVTDDYIICLENGKRFKSMRGHLRKLGMTPNEYRAKWKLPHDYPMVAPSYAARRSEMAVASGLGDHIRELSTARKSAKSQQEES